MMRGTWTFIEIIDFSTVAAIATERYNQALREAGREDAVSRRPAYSPADVMYILAAIFEEGDAVRQEREGEAV